MGVPPPKPDARARPRAAVPARAPLQPPHREGLRRLDPPLHPLPRQAPPRRRWARPRSPASSRTSPSSAQVSASTQNQAFSALLFLYRDVLGRELAGLEDVAARQAARAPARSSSRATRCAPSCGRLRGTPRLMASLLYGAGLRLLECCRLRVKDVDFARSEITVRDGKGAQGPRHRAARPRSPSRCARTSSACSACTRPTSPAAPATSPCPTPSPASTRTRAASGPGSGSSRPPRLYADAATGERRRHHLHETVLQRAFAAAVRARRHHQARHAATPSATPSPPTCSRPATTSAPSRSCSATPTSRTTMIYTHVLNRGGRGVRSPLDLHRV